MTEITEQERNRRLEQYGVVEEVAGRLAYEPRFLAAVRENEQAFIADPACDLGVPALNALVEAVRDLRNQPGLSEAANSFVWQVCAAFINKEQRAFAEAFRCAVQRQIVESEPESGGRIFADNTNGGYFVAASVYPAGTAENFAEVARLMAIGPEVTPDSVCVHVMGAMERSPKERAAYDANPVQFVADWLKVPVKDAYERCCVTSLAQEAVQVINDELAQAA